MIRTTTALLMVCADTEVHEREKARNIFARGLEDSEGITSISMCIEPKAHIFCDVDDKEDEKQSVAIPPRALTEGNLGATLGKKRRNA